MGNFLIFILRIIKPNLYLRNECYCSNKYGMDGKGSDDQCNCVCSGRDDDYCGCQFFYKVFKLESIDF